MLFGTLAGSILVSALRGRGLIRSGEGVIRAAFLILTHAFN